MSVRLRLQVKRNPSRELRLHRLQAINDVPLDMDGEELDDLAVVSETARPCKTKIDKILHDEVERAKGAVAVACKSLVRDGHLGGCLQHRHEKLSHC